MRNIFSKWECSWHVYVWYFFHNSLKTLFKEFLTLLLPFRKFLQSLKHILPHLLELHCCFSDIKIWEYKERKWDDCMWVACALLLWFLWFLIYKFHIMALRFMWKFIRLPCRPNLLVKWSALLLHIQKVLSTEFSQETGYPG